MLREIARSFETAVAQIENFAKPEEVQARRKRKCKPFVEKVKCSLGLLILINLNRIIKKNVFVAEKQVIERKFLIVRQEIVNVLNAIKRDIMRDVVKRN